MFKKEDAMLLKSTARRLGYHSSSEFAMALFMVRQKCAFTALDLKILASIGLEGYLKISNSVVTVTGTNEKEVLEKLGLKDAKKIADSTKKSTSKTKKKHEEPQFFKGIEKPKGEI